LYRSTPHDAIVEAVKGGDGIVSQETVDAFAIEVSAITRDLNLDDADVRYVARRAEELMTTTRSTAQRPRVLRLQR
jgi:hypothetical protein